jgi:hypothetical protein
VSGRLRPIYVIYVEISSFVGRGVPVALYVALPARGAARRGHGNLPVTAACLYRDNRHFMTYPDSRLAAHCPDSFAGGLVQPATLVNEFLPLYSKNCAWSLQTAGASVN